MKKAGCLMIVATLFLGIVACGCGKGGGSHSSNNLPIIPPPGGGGTVTKANVISLGWSHSCALTTTGGVKCWGHNGHGQIGDNTATDRWTPVDVIGLSSGVAMISAGGNHTCALTMTGGVKCWGYNYYGQLGDNSTTDRLTPVDVIGLSSGVVAISSGGGHTCALTTAGGVKCWGQGWFGDLGDGAAVNRLTPVDVVGLSNGVAAISVAEAYTCALTNAGGVKCWGYNMEGQLGDGTTTERDVPVDVSGLTSGVAAIFAGGSSKGHTCALTMTSVVKCWGFNGYGQIGDNSTTDRLTPVDVVGLSSGVAKILTGADPNHTCAITTTGGVKCWGFNGYGQIGDTSTTDRWSPVDVIGLPSGVAAISAGGNHTCALTTAGGVKCWGYNNYGQVGDNTTTDRYAPVDVSGL